MKNKPSPQEIFEQAKRAYQNGDFISANLSYENAANAFSEAGDHLMAAEMKNNQSVTLLRSKQFQAALEASQGTELIFARAGDVRRQGIALANQASALQALKRYKEAIDYFSRAGETLEKANEMDLRVEVMQLLSALYLRRFKVFDAIIALQSGLAGIQNPTPKQRLMKKLLFFRL
jgi:tetratricopeptide (TPR) repeat protein